MVGAALQVMGKRPGTENTRCSIDVCPHISAALAFVDDSRNAEMGIALCVNAV